MVTNEGTDNKTVLICLLLSIVIFILDSSVPLGVAGGVPYILVILISLRSYRKRLPIFVAICTSALTVIGFFSSPIGGELWKVLANRFLALFAIWVVTILSLQRRKVYEEKEQALLEIKQLRGFLPICSSCKQIRDDQGYWNQIESYIRDHSEVEFSHSLCPDCAKELYPDLDLTNISDST